MTNVQKTYHSVNYNRHDRLNSTDKITILYIKIFTCLDSRRQDKDSELNDSKYSPNFVWS
jgi:hypothetical protein